MTDAEYLKLYAELYPRFKEFIKEHWRQSIHARIHLSMMRNDVKSLQYWIDRVVYYIPEDIARTKPIPDSVKALYQLHKVTGVLPN